MKLLYIALLLLAVHPATAQEKRVPIDQDTARRLQQIQREDEARKKAQEQMRVTRSDWGETSVTKKAAANKTGCSFDPEQMKRYANTVDASRGKAGLLQMPSLIQQSRQIDRQCNEQMLPPALQKKPEPNAMHAVEK